MEKLIKWTLGTVATTMIPMGTMVPFNESENMYLLRPVIAVGWKVPKEIEEAQILGNFGLEEADLARYKGVMTEEERKLRLVVQYYEAEVELEKAKAEVERREAEGAKVWDEEEVVVIDE